MSNFIEDKELYPYKIQLDEHCYILIKETFSDVSHHLSKGKSKAKESVLGYFTNISLLIKTISRDSTNNKDYSSIQEYCDAFIKKQKQLTNLIKI